MVSFGEIAPNFCRQIRQVEKAARNMRDRSATAPRPKRKITDKLAKNHRKMSVVVDKYYNEINEI
jgi:hypothetical protein